MDPTDPMPVWERGNLLGELSAEAVDARDRGRGPRRRRPAHHGRAAPARRGARPPARSCRTRSPAADGRLLAVHPRPPMGAGLRPGRPGCRKRAVMDAMAAWTTGAGPCSTTSATRRTPGAVSRAGGEPEVFAGGCWRSRAAYDPQNVFRFGQDLVSVSRSCQVVVQRTVTRTGSGSRPSSRTSGAADSRANGAQRELGHRHQRAGVAGADRGVGLAVLHRVDREAHRGRLGAADRLARLFVAGDHIRGWRIVGRAAQVRGGARARPWIWRFVAEQQELEASRSPAPRGRRAGDHRAHGPPSPPIASTAIAGRRPSLRAPPVSPAVRPRLETISRPL